jgi:uroporphyrinogen-III synthase
MNSLLKGMRVLNTRPKDQAKALSDRIRAAGGIAIECPALEISTSNENWIAELPDLHTVDQAIFISPNAVRYCFQQLQQHALAWPSSIAVTAIGQGSAAMLTQYQVRVDTIPVQADSEHLVMLPNFFTIANQTILLFKGNGGRPLIEETLLQRGAKVSAFSVYERSMPKLSRQFITSLWQENQVDIILLTSEESMHNLFTLFGEPAHDWLKNKLFLVISERVAQAAAAFGIKNIQLFRDDL